MTADYHLHSSFSGDSRTNPEDAVRAGIERGLSLLCFTDHFDPDYPYPEVSMELDVPAYVSEIRKLQALYQEQIEIRLGAELGIQPHLGEFLRSWAGDCASGGYPFDFLIGSTHLVDRLDPYLPGLLGGPQRQGGRQPLSGGHAGKHPCLRRLRYLRPSGLCHPLCSENRGPRLFLRRPRRADGRHPAPPD